jgi:hypothetical protein
MTGRRQRERKITSMQATPEFAPHGQITGGARRIAYLNTVMVSVWLSAKTETGATATITVRPIKPKRFI